MTTPRCLRRLLLSTAFALTATTLSLHTPHAQADSPAIAPAASPDEISRLAEQGRFDQVLAKLQSPDIATAEGVPTLAKEVEAYNAARDAQNAARRKDFDRVVVRMNRQADAGRYEDAVISAVEAASLSDDAAKFRSDAHVVALLKKTEAAAEAAEKAGDWVEALNLYRALDLLFDDYATYHTHAKKASRHLRVLRIYTPDRLEVLLKNRAARLKKDREADAALDAAENPETKPDDKQDDKKKTDAKDNEVRIDKEPWQDRLKDVEPAMLRQALAQASRRHVSNRGYAGLLRGSLESLNVLLDTPDLGETFPGLKDATRADDFRKELATARADIERDPLNLSFLDAASTVDTVLAANKKTVQLPEAVIIYEMTDGALDTLDEFSAIIWPRDVESFARNFRGNFFGVGVQISLRDDRIVVITPIEGTPAQRAGLRAGDIIASVDDMSTTGWSLDKAVSNITGEKGTPVTLGIERAGVQDKISVKLVRAEISIESIKGWSLKPAGGWDYYIDPDLRIGYVRLLQFIPQSAQGLDAAITQMQQAGGCNALILDLRFNPGGLLTSAVDIVNRFVPEGPIVSTVGPDESRNSEFRARADRATATFPVIVLVNQGSASASEIVSGALQDYSRALILGSRSFGKGSVQDVFPIDGQKAYLKLTTQHYKLPQGRIIHRQPEAKVWGIEPDLTVKMTDKQVLDAIEVRQSADVIRNADDPVDPNDPVHQPAELLDKSLDPQLQAALLILKTRLITSNIAVAKK